MSLPRRVPQASNPPNGNGPHEGSGGQSASGQGPRWDLGTDKVNTGSGSDDGAIDVDNPLGSTGPDEIQR